jgi:hypothetical protein
MRRRLLALLLSTPLAILAGPALAASFSFVGFLTADDDVKLFSFTADGASTVTLRTYSYAGGVQANGNFVFNGGFDPTLALFDSSGAVIGLDDDGSAKIDPNTGQSWDSELSAVLAAGTYTVSISQFDNFATGPNLSNGFDQTGFPFFTAELGFCGNGQFCDVSGSAPFNNRTSDWAFDVLNVVAAVPEPGTGLLVMAGVLGLAGWRRRSA